MLQFKGKILGVTDEVRQFPEKDKNGVPTGRLNDRRIVKIQMLCSSEDGKNQFAINVSSFDPDRSLVVPKVGTDWMTPEVKKYDNSKGFPEVSI